MLLLKPFVLQWMIFQCQENHSRASFWPPKISAHYKSEKQTIYVNIKITTIQTIVVNLKRHLFKITFRKVVQLYFAVERLCLAHFTLRLRIFYWKILLEAYSKISKFSDWTFKKKWKKKNRWVGCTAICTDLGQLNTCNKPLPLFVTIFFVYFLDFQYIRFLCYLATYLKMMCC